MILTQNNTPYEGKVLEVLTYPDPRLQTISIPVLDPDITAPANKDLYCLVQDMLATMKHNNALGLAGIQVGVPLRVLTVNVNNVTKVVINPVFTDISFEQEVSKEGCLSFPGLSINVSRPKNVKIKFTNQFGKEELVEAKDLLARAILHEVDHLDGKVFIDKLNRFAKESALNKYRIAKRRSK